jgi:hypothetical protein
MKVVEETRGQAIVLAVVFMTAALGMGALVLDVGSWFRADRATQATADAAALAAVQELPDNAGAAPGVALTYANKNGGGVAGSDITISSNLAPNDTVQVHVQRTAPGFFSKVLGLGDVTVGSTATARAYGMADAKYVAPIGVNISQQELSAGGCPCFNQATTLPLNRLKAPGAFDMINLGSGSAGSSTLATWITGGYDGYLPLGGYFSSAGAKWNSSEVQGALTQRIGSTLLFPVYDSVSGTGSNASYHVIAWVGFYLTGIDARGSAGSLSGYFTEVIWEGLAATTAGDGGPNLGAHTVRLVN